MTLYTVGHGTRTAEELAEVLASAEIRLLVDVRRHPGSRRHPHLGRDNLAAELPAHGIDYEWQGETLGGRRSRVADSRHPAWRNASFQGYADHMDTAEFRDAMAVLLQQAEARRTAVMCSETLWWRCHRRLIADAAVLQGVPVVHLLSATDHPAHVLTAEARPGDDGWPVYDAGQPPLA